MEVFWSSETNQVLFHPTKTRRDGHDLWYSSYNANIIASIGFFLRGRSHQIVVDHIRVFDKTERISQHEELLPFYEANWANYASEEKIVHFNFRIFNWIKNEVERLEATMEYDLISTWQMTDDAAYGSLLQKIRIAKIENDAEISVYCRN